MKRLFVLLLCAGCAAAHALGGTPPTVTARIEPDSIGIGDRFDYVIEVEKDLVQEIGFPVFEQQGPGLELVKDHATDTLLREGRLLKLRKRYTMQAFEEGDYRLGRGEVLYIDKNIVDTLRTTERLHLEVTTFQIDSTSHSIFDLKPQRDLPFRMGEIRGYLLWSLFGLLLLAAALWALLRYLKKRGATLGGLFAPAPALPPHVEAIQALEELHNRKLWQNNRHKQYYSGLTDILRSYIARRWEVGAMEMTTDEILGALRPLDLPDKARMDLTAILRDGDLVKFAKATPDAETNENAYLKAYYFVEETKPATEQAEPNAENE